MFGVSKNASASKSCKSKDSLLVKLLEKRVCGYSSYTLESYDDYSTVYVDYAPMPGYRVSGRLHVSNEHGDVEARTVEHDDDGVLDDLLDLCQLGNVTLSIASLVQPFFNGEDSIEVLHKGTTLEMLKIELELDDVQVMDEAKQ